MALGELQYWLASANRLAEAFLHAYLGTQGTCLPRYQPNLPTRLGVTYLLHTYPIALPTGCHIDGIITFADQQVLEEGQTFQVARKGKRRHGLPLSLRPVGRLRSALRDGPGRDGAPLQRQIHCTPRQGRSNSVSCGPAWHLGAGLQRYRGTLYLPGDLPYLYLP